MMPIRTGLAPRLTKAALVAAATLTLALPAGIAAAQGLALNDLTITLGYPKPWPLKNLVEPGKLTVVTTGKTQNETFVNDKGELQGARIELWEKLAQDLGLQPEFVQSDWAGVIPGISANRFDMGCEAASWTNDRLTSKDFFMTRPITVQVDVAVVRKDSGIDSFADMTNKKFGGVKGEIEIKALADKVGVALKDTLGLPGVPESRLALLNKQIDVYGTNLNAATALLTGADGDKFKMISQPTLVGVGGFCINGREPDLLTAVNFLMAQYRADGTIKALNEKWGLPDTSDLLTKLGY